MSVFFSLRQCSNIEHKLQDPSFTILLKGVFGTEVSGEGPLSQAKTFSGQPIVSNRSFPTYILYLGVSHGNLVTKLPSVKGAESALS